MKIGDLKHRITFKTRAASQNDYGEELSWTTVKTVWAAAEPILGNEYFAADRINTKVEYKFKCRYFTGLNEKLRITFDSVDFEILDAQNIKMMDRDVIIYAKKVQL
jgi:SPP1 family predicted phage head-tail adaptor